TVIIALLLATIFYINENAKETIHKQTRATALQTAYDAKLATLSADIQRLGISVYQLSFIGDHHFSSEIQALMPKIAALANNLDLPDSDIYNEKIGALTASLDVLFGQINTLLAVQNDVEKRYPAMPIMVNKLQPANINFTTAVIDAINEAKFDTEGGVVYDQLRNIRYSWAQLISSVRVFVANRLGAFGPPQTSMEQTENNRNIYANAVRSGLDRLKQYSAQGKLGLVQENALAIMEREFEYYEANFKLVAEIYYSENWRADHSLMRDGIDPMLGASMAMISELREDLAVDVVKGASDVEAVADTLSETLWGVFALVTTLLLLMYSAFDFLIRKPLLQISRALEAEGAGVKYNMETNVNILETQNVIDAFSKMRNQVKTRQLRLQSILDNAGEGILTVDRFGRIETFNNAAEALFGYSEEEVRGQNASMIIPAFHTIKHKNDVVQTSVLKKSSLLQKEQEIVGRNKLSEIFPMSIRLGRVLLEGEILYVALVSDISERKAMVDRLKQLAERDSLTGLYNRHFFMDELERVIERTQRHERMRATLLYVDLDNFKYVNDTLGHLAGDQVLSDVSKVLVKRARGSDLLVRLGGDEFAILLYDADAKQALDTAEAYRQQLSDFVFQFEGNTLDIGCSIGVALLDYKIKKKEELLVRADLACHIAKRLGKNRVYVFEEKDQKNATEMSTDMGWARRIKDSIENNQFFTNCQPIMHMKSGVVTSQEVLLRMKDKSGEMIMPSGFLPSAERFGLMQEIDRWVIKHSMRNLINKKSSPQFRFAINLSAKSIGDQSILALIERELDQNGVNPNNVVFEVTENSAIHNLNAAVDFLKKLQSLGFKTALDDFGVGYSSFSYLKDLPVDLVKIDRSFVQNLTNDKVKRAIVSSMNDVA
ncbi:MAG: EAL domain-containing protein, partial [Gammaproteobacteria bacterium]|nr:EAL domain-containing protein [Gammaproteobacteria bacterium]